MSIFKNQNRLYSNKKKKKKILCQENVYFDVFAKCGYYIKKTQITIYTIKLSELGLYVAYYFFHVTKNNYISLNERKYEQYLVICKYLNANLH